MLGGPIDAVVDLDRRVLAAHRGASLVLSRRGALRENVRVTSDQPVFPDPTASITPLLAVVDLDASLQFWVEQLGGEVQVRWDTYALVRVGAGQLHLAVAGDAPPDRSIRLVPPDRDQAVASGEVVLQVADCRAVVAALLERGVQFLGPPAEPPWGGEVRAFTRDPDGHLVEITSAT